MSTVEANVYGLDFLAAYPDAQLIKSRGIKFVACYLKNWNKVRVAEYMAQGISVIPIGEVSTTRAEAGATAGTIDAVLWVRSAKDVGIPNDNSVPIIMTHDSSKWTDACADYFVAAEKAVRAGGFLFGIYGSKKAVDASRAKGATFDLIWATNAYAWGGGRHADAHVWQGGHGNVNRFFNPMWNGTPLDVSGMGLIDTNVSKRPFPAWLSVAPVVPPKPIKPKPPKPAPLPPFDPANGLFSLYPLAKKPSISKGSSGDVVKYLQGVILCKAGGDISVDGAFGPQTDKRVRDLQKFFKLTVDGIVGPQTWGVIDYLAVH